MHSPVARPLSVRLQCERLETRDTPAGIVAVGPESGLPVVRVLDAQNLTERFFIQAFDSTFRGGVRVAVGDVNNDGTPDIVAAAGAGDQPLVRVFSGKDGRFLREIVAYDPRFRGGVFVAVGDVNKDGFDDVITGRGAGVTLDPQVKIFSGKDGTLLGSYDTTSFNFRGPIHVAAGDVNKDGFADVITGQGLNGSSEVRVVSGQSIVPGKPVLDIHRFYAFGTSFRGGVTVAAGDVDGDGFVDIVTATQFGLRQVRVFDGAAASQRVTSMRGQFFAEFGGLRTGLQISTTDADLDGRADIIALSNNGKTVVRRGDTLQLLRSFGAVPGQRRGYIAGEVV